MSMNMEIITGIIGLATIGLGFWTLLIHREQAKFQEKMKDIQKEQTELQRAQVRLQEEETKLRKATLEAQRENLEISREEDYSNARNLISILAPRVESVYEEARRMLISVERLDGFSSDGLAHSFSASTLMSLNLDVSVEKIEKLNPAPEVAKGMSDCVKKIGELHNIGDSSKANSFALCTRKDGEGKEIHNKLLELRDNLEFVLVEMKKVSES